MATKFVCDRCDKYTDDKQEITTVNAPVWQQYQRNLENWPTKDYDLCAGCIRELTEFMKPLPKPVNFP